MRFPTFSNSKDNVPIISNKAIEDTVEDILRDFDPTCLEVPKPLDVDMFVEKGLGIDIDFPYLSHTGFIFGKTIFRPTIVTIYDKTNDIADEIPIHNPTILIDNRLNEKGKENLYRSTVMHESAHYVLHQEYYRQDPMHMKHDFEPFTNCSNNDICGSDGKRKLVSARDFLEHHAKFASAAFLMNRSAMTRLCTDESVIHDVFRRDPDFPDSELAAIVAETFKVSEESARIRINTLKLGITQDKIAIPFGYSIQRANHISLAGIVT